MGRFTFIAWLAIAGCVGTVLSSRGDDTPVISPDAARSSAPIVGPPVVKPSNADTAASTTPKTSATPPWCREPIGVRIDYNPFAAKSSSSAYFDGRLAEATRDFATLCENDTDDPTAPRLLVTQSAEDAMFPPAPSLEEQLWLDPSVPHRRHDCDRITACSAPPCSNRWRLCSRCNRCSRRRLRRINRAFPIRVRIRWRPPRSPNWRPPLAVVRHKGLGSSKPRPSPRPIWALCCNRRTPCKA